MKYCEFCGGKIEGSSPCFICARAPYDRAPVPGALYDTETGEIKPPTIEGALNKVSIIGFEHINGETHTLVCLEDVKKALREFAATPTEPGT